MIKKYLSVLVVTVVVLYLGKMFYDTRISKIEINMEQEEKSGLIIEDIIVGTGAKAEAGKKVSVHYRGTLTDGTQFDNSYDRGTPFELTLGEGTVIPGWEQGLLGMAVGGKRKLTIPPELGYGARGQGPIPPNSTLVFEVELLTVK